MGENGTRGQWGNYDAFMTTLAIGTAVAAITAIAIAVNAEREARHANKPASS